MNKYRYLKRIILAEETHAPFGVGSFIEGNILIIGEQASNPENSPNQRPFCCHKGCSGWLNALLDGNDIPEEELFWVNALNNDDTVIDIKLLVEQLKPRKVFALGTVAQHHCKQQGVEHVPMYHPQYWKRFKHREQYPLIVLLRDLTVNYALDKEAFLRT